MSVCENLIELQQKIPKNVTLVAVSKTKPVEQIKTVYDAGIRVFGENKVQELTDKYDQLPKDIQWHMIGHLQRNKVKYIAPFIHLIHSVDSIKLLREINKEGGKNKRKIPCLLQVHIALEENKHGFDQEELLELLSSGILREFQHVSVNGLMGMATYTQNQDQIRKEFSTLNTLFTDIKKRFFTESNNFNALSMGMSNDFEIAIEEGSNMIRIGSIIFGSRS